MVAQIFSVESRERAGYARNSMYDSLPPSPGRTPPSVPLHPAPCVYTCLDSRAFSRYEISIDSALLLSFEIAQLVSCRYSIQCSDYPTDSLSLFISRLIYSDNCLFKIILSQLSLLHLFIPLNGKLQVLVSRIFNECREKSSECQELSFLNII